MNASAHWLNLLLDHRDQGPLSASQIEHSLTFAGFPLESTTPATFGEHPDSLMDVEVTSNRGDCLCHVGLARELAASTGRGLKPLALADLESRATGPAVGTVASLSSEAGTNAPHFLAVVIRGVKVGPSPAWLRDALVSIGQRSISNVVDALNYVLHELGNPSHAFDLGRIARDARGLAALTVRMAHAGEKLCLLDGSTRDLKPSDVVIADASGPISLAGVMGGQSTAVSDSTTDLVLEMATWRPAVVRGTARRLNIRSDASHRYERQVDARTLPMALRRLVEVVQGVAGGSLAPGVLSVGQPIAAPVRIALSHDRCCRTIGLMLTEGQVSSALASQGFLTQPAAGGLSATVPAHRPDVTIEADLIEEVARTIGYARVPVKPALPVTLTEPQRSERASRAMHRVLNGVGFFEAVTFSFTTAKKAAPFIRSGLSCVSVSDDRRGHDNVLRPSVLTGLLDTRRANLTAKVEAPGGLRLYEVAAGFAQESPVGAAGSTGVSIERRQLALLADLPERDASGATLKGKDRGQLGLRLMRGVIDALADELAGAGSVSVVPATPGVPAYDPGAFAEVRLGGNVLGCFGLLTDAVTRAWELDCPLVAAELLIDPLFAGYPPRRTAHALPAFPATQRDLSLIVPDATAWDSIGRVVGRVSMSWLEALQFVGVYRGQPIEPGRKSVTFRMTFRDATRTLRDDEVNAQVDRLVSAMHAELGAVVRTS